MNTPCVVRNDDEYSIETSMSISTNNTFYTRVYNMHFLMRVSTVVTYPHSYSLKNILVLY